MNTQKIRIVIGKNILELRNNYGISRASLARLIKMPISRLRRIEMGDTSAKMYDFHMKRIANIFGVTIENLVKCEENKQEKEQ